MKKDGLGEVFMKNKVISVVLSLLVAASMFALSGCNKEKSNNETTTQPNETASYQETTMGNSSELSEVQTETKATEKQSEAETSAAATEPSAAEMTTEQIVELFNASANKIKTDASKVVKNYEKRNLDEEELDMPKVLESVAETMIPVFMKDDTEPIVYASKDEITENYLVPNQSYVSKMKASDVAEATCEDNGKEYVIFIRLKNENNPVPGSGVGAVCDVIEANEVAEKASFIEKFTTEYYNCTVKARIDKATGKIVWANYTTPLVLNVTVKMFGTHNVSAGLTFEKDYTISY